jgi:glycosyltransferase involved in cell wall biosynthesis
LVGPGNDAALATAIQELIADPERRRRLATQARQTALERFSRPRLGREVAAIHQRLV